MEYEVIHGSQIYGVVNYTIFEASEKMLASHPQTPCGVWEEFSIHPRYAGFYRSRKYHFNVSGRATKDGYFSWKL